MESERGSITQRRSKYGRPCDNCSLRKVKCDKTMPCSRCIKYDLPCTNNRETKKRGPKTMRPKTINTINLMYSKTMSSNPTITRPQVTTSPPDVFFQPHISLAELLPCLHIYQTWYYEIWPVLSVSQLTSSITSKETSGKLDLNPDNLQSYALCCALAGTIKEQLHFISSYDEVINIPQNLKYVDFIAECLRARNYCDYRFNPTIETILVSFFLHVYYTDVELCSPPALLYLREAISLAEILGLNDESRYQDLSIAEKHKLRNIYYILVITERFTCLDANIPVLLDANIPYASVIDEDHPSFGDFSEIVKIFALPDKSFFLNRFNSDVLNNPRFSKKLIFDIQKELTNIKTQDKTPEIQKLNILLSKNWMRLLVWNLCNSNKLIADNGYEDDCFNQNFPIKVARELLGSTQHLPLYAFESNGPGVSTKLLEIAEGISKIMNDNNFSIGYDTLTSILGIVSRLNNNITVSNDIQKRMNKILTSKRVMSLSDYNIANYERHSSTSSEKMFYESSPKIEMINENAGSVSGEEDCINDPETTSSTYPQFSGIAQDELSKWSPFSQLSMAFNIFSNAVSPDLGGNINERNVFQGYTPRSPFDTSSAILSKERHYQDDSISKDY